MTASDVAIAHQERVTRRAEVAAQKALRIWRSQVSARDLDLSWVTAGPAITKLGSDAQLLNAAGTSSYINQASRFDDLDTLPAAVIPQSLSGIDGSGRPLGNLLHGSVTTTKTAIGAGMSIDQAMVSGGVYLVAMMKTAIHDLARQSEMAAAGGHGYTSYVRVVSAGACSRCAILAGITGYKAGFKRHPACKCSSYPVPGGDRDQIPSGIYDTPEGYFESLPAAEQDRIFTKAGAEAIREGADVSRVVGARRGASGISYGGGSSLRPNRGVLQSETVGFRPDGTPIRVYSTNEATTRRGFYGRQAANRGRVRLMPESIMQIADGDATKARVLLRDAGYIRTDFRLSPAARAAQARSDREYAQRILRQAGFTF